MSVHLGIKLFQVPRAQQFVDNILEGLIQGRSALVLTPVGSDPNAIWERLRSELWRRDFEFREVLLPQLPTDRVPVAALGSVLQVEWGSPDQPHTVANLLALNNLPDVIQLGGFYRLQEPERMGWLGFLSQWAQASQCMADRGRSPKPLCMFAPAADILSHLPLGDIYLAVYWWWGIPSALELRLLCRLEENRGGLDAKARWREHILPSLAGSDIALAEYLWDDLYLDIEPLNQRLRMYAEEREWTAKAMHEWGANELRELMIADSSNFIYSGPPERLRNLWTRGALIWTEEYGVELHTAALVVLGQQDALNHRLWRGQAALLLPEIDAMRLNLCISFTQTYGKDWPLWHSPGSTEEDNSPFACQLGRLELLLRNCREFRSERRWLPLVSRLRYVRNELAHYRPIKFSDFECIYREIGSSASL